MYPYMNTIDLIRVSGKVSIHEYLVKGWIRVSVNVSIYEYYRFNQFLLKYPSMNTWLQGGSEFLLMYPYMNTIDLIRVSDKVSIHEYLVTGWITVSVNVSIYEYY